MHTRTHAHTHTRVLQALPHLHNMHTPFHDFLEAVSECIRVAAAGALMAVANPWIARDSCRALSLATRAYIRADEDDIMAVLRCYLRQHRLSTAIDFAARAEGGVTYANMCVVTSNAGSPPPRTLTLTYFCDMAFIHL